MSNWNEIRTAYFVARTGTISGAARHLDIHRATVLRHIDTLESQLGTKLFHRTPKGYLPTEAGEQMVRVAAATEDQMAQFESRVRSENKGLSGRLTVTVLPALLQLVMPAVRLFRDRNREVSLDLIAINSLLRVEYGEAHVAIRSGPKPNEPDNVVLPFASFCSGLYASRDYASRFMSPIETVPLSEMDVLEPDFTEERSPIKRWLGGLGLPSKSGVRCSTVESHREALIAGLGVGFLPEWDALIGDVVIEVRAPHERWSVESWLVTHRDMHRSAKVNAFLDAVKETRWAPVRRQKGSD